MKIILISKIARLGNIGDVVSVKDGYAKNFLIPQKKAIFYNLVNFKIFEEKKQQFESDNQKKSSQAEINKKKLDEKNIIIIGSASDDGRLYGSVSTALVASKINKIIGSEIISRLNIILKKPIKEVGLHDVRVELHSGVSSNVSVVVARSDSEASIMINKSNSLSELSLINKNNDQKETIDLEDGLSSKLREIDIVSQ